MMERPSLLHLTAAAENVRPFAVNMAFDAGGTAVAPYTHVELDDVAPLVQDAIFSRSPKRAKRSGIVIGGRDLHLALDIARQSLHHG